MANALLAIGLAGNDRSDAVSFEEGAEGIGVIGFISQKLGHAWDQADAGFSHHAIGGVTRGEDEDPGPAELIDDRMNLAVAPAFGDPDRLRLCPPFPPLAQRWIFT